MRCKYGDQWLTGTPFQEECGEVTWNGSQQAEPVPLVDAETPAIDSYGNRLDQLPVPIVLQCESELDALRRAAELVWTLPGTGILMFEEQRGANKVTITYPNAAFQNVRRQRFGTAVQFQFAFLVSGPPEIVVEDDTEIISGEDGHLLTTG